MKTIHELAKEFADEASQNTYDSDAAAYHAYREGFNKAFLLLIEQFPDMAEEIKQVYKRSL